ncbi:MAG: Gfo/Idh/MocA family oxidoreductase [Prolixibacteraceae bacterium]
MGTTTRRNFIERTVLTGTVLGMTGGALEVYGHSADMKGRKIGMIGLDTSHCVAFTKALNSPEVKDEFFGYRIVAAYPHGSRDIASSVERIPGYTAEVQKYGVKIVQSIEELIAESDVVLLETNDGRLHLEQAIPVIKAGKRMFIDKPMTASLADAISIFDAARKWKVSIFSGSSLRYITGMDEIISGHFGKILGAETYSPAKLEKTHPDLFWYGIHGVETLFAAMGTGCKSVVRTSNENTDLVTGVWNDGRIGTFRGIRKGTADYGGTIFCESAIRVLGGYAGYNPLLVQIINFFMTGIAPVREEETLEILAFMEAADRCKTSMGVPVLMENVMREAAEKASRIKI